MSFTQGQKSGDANSLQRKVDGAKADDSNNSGVQHPDPSVQATREIAANSQVSNSTGIAASPSTSETSTKTATSDPASPILGGLSSNAASKQDFLDSVGANSSSVTTEEPPSKKSFLEAVGANETSAGSPTKSPDKKDFLQAIGANQATTSSDPIGPSKKEFVELQETEEAVEESTEVNESGNGSPSTVAASNSGDGEDQTSEDTDFEETSELEEETIGSQSVEDNLTVLNDDPVEDSIPEDRTSWESLWLSTIIVKKLGLTYEDVSAVFKAKNGDHADFNAWIKKSIIEKGWTRLSDPVPNIHEIVVTYKEERDRGVLQRIPYIEAYSYNDAFAHAGRIGLTKNASEPFYWVTKIYGTAVKYRYNFSTNEGYKNLINVKKIVGRTTLITSEYMQEQFFEDLLYVTGDAGKELYIKMLSKTAWNDRLLSNELVKLVFIAQQKQAEIDESNAFSTNGIISGDFVLFVKYFKSNEILRKKNDAKRQKELEDKLKADQAAQQEILEKVGEPILGKEEYRRYYRGNKTVDVVEADFTKLKNSLKDRKASNDAFFEVIDERGAWNQLQQDLFYLLSIEERKTALYHFANASYLNDSREELALISMLQNTPPKDHARLKGALESKHGSYDKLQYALKANVSSGNTKELTIVIDNIVGYGKRVSKSDLTYRNGNLLYIYEEKVSELSPKQVHRLTMTEYEWFVKALQNQAFIERRGKGLVNLMIYANSEQQAWLRKHLTENNLKRMRILKENLSNSLWGKLRFGESAKSGYAIDFTGQDQKVVNKNKRGSGLENLFHNDDVMYKTAMRILDGSSHKGLPDVKATLATIPFEILKDILIEDEDRILRMLKFLTKGGASSSDEYAIIRALKTVRSVYSEKEEQQFYYKLKGYNGSGFGNLVEDIEKDMDDLYYEWRQILNDFNEAGSKARIEKTISADAGDIDSEIATLSDEDLKSLAFWKRTHFISKLVGSDSWWNQFWTVTGDEDENSVIRLVNATPHDQINKLYDYLFKNKGERFEAIQSAIDGSEFAEFHETLKQRNFAYIEENLVEGIDGEKDAEKLAEHWEKLSLMRLAGGDYQKGQEQDTKQFHFNDPSSLKLIVTNDIRTQYDFSFTDSGKLRITITDQTAMDVLMPYIAPGTGIIKSQFAGNNSVLLDPMQLITVKHERDDSDLGVSQGDVVTMPAIGLFYYKNKADNRTIMEFVDLALIALSVATLGAATGPAMTFIAILEIVAATSDILLRSFKEEIPPDIADIWETLNLIVMAPALVVGAAQLIKGAVSKLGKFIESAAFQKLSKPFREVLKLKHEMNSRFIEDVAYIRSTHNLDDLARLEKEMLKKGDDPFARSVIDEIEIRRGKINKQKVDQKNLDELDESLKKQQEVETKSVYEVGGSNSVTNGVVNSADELAEFVTLHKISLPINKVEYVIQITGGQRNLCESILLSTKEVVSGKNLSQLVQYFNIRVLPSPNSLSNYQTRIWYKWRKGEIPNLLNKSKSLEEQAEQAFNLRNQFRTNARTHMSDRPLANYLESVEQNMSWQQMKDKHPNLSGDALWNKIIEKSSSGREGVDDLFNLNNL